MDLALALRAFARTVERGSVTVAARDLGLSQPAVSKLLRNLEAHVRVRLMERNARSLRPTLQGLHLYETTCSALATIDGAIEALRAEAGAVTGRLRLHGPVCLGERRLHDIVAGFQERHPDVSVRLTLENRVVDMIHEGIDLAVGMGRPTAGDVVLRRIGMVRRILVAAPAYLERRGLPRAPGCLAGHALLATDTVLDRGHLTLRRGSETSVLAVEPILTTNNAQVLLDAILAGRGVGTAQVQLVAEALAEGRLVRVLPDHEIPATELTLAYPSARLLRPTVRAFIDYAVPALRGIEGIDPASSDA